MWMEILRRNEAESLAVNCLDRSGGQLFVEGDREDLEGAAFDPALQLGVAASNRDNRKAEIPENLQDPPIR